MKIKVIGKTKMFRISGNDVLEFLPGYSFTCDPECNDYDWLVVFDEVNERTEVRCPVERTILATWEPVSIKKYSRSYVCQFGHYLTNRPYSAERHPHYHLGRGYFPWFVLRPYSEIVDKSDFHKTKTISAVCSKKCMRHTAHHRRFTLLNHLMKAIPDMEWFGFGFNRIEGGKQNALDGYKYHVVVENHIAPYHWSEKLPDAILCECLPFYAGDPMLDEVLPSEAFIRIPIDDLVAAERIIKKAMANNEWERRLSAVREAKHLLLTKYNFWAQVIDVIESQDVDCAPVSPWYLIPRRKLKWLHPFETLKDYVSRMIFYREGV